MLDLSPYASVISLYANDPNPIQNNTSHPSPKWD